MGSFVYKFYVVLGAIIILCVPLALIGGENVGWVLVGVSGVFYFLLAPAVVVLTTITLFASVDWKLVGLLVSTLVFLGIVFFGAFGGAYVFALGQIGQWIVIVSHVCYAIVALVLPTWHFMSEKTASHSSAS
jgi:hypothetical protein